MSFDDLDDLLNGEDELEAAFRELDAKIKMDEMRAKRGPSRGRASTSKGRTSSSSGKAERRSGHGKAARAKDPLADLKAAFDGAASPKQSAAPKPKPSKSEGPRYVVVVCPSCSTKNRVSLGRLRTRLPICGRCKTDLSFERT